MKIPVKATADLSDPQKQIITLLENDESFEKLVWITRGILGIKPEDLEIKTSMPPRLKTSYQNAWDKRPNFPEYSTIATYIDELATISEKSDNPLEEMKRLTKTKKGEEIIDDKFAAIEKFISVKQDIVTKILNKYQGISRSWEQPISTFIEYGQMYVQDSIEPVVIHFSTQTLRRYKATPYIDNPKVAKYRKRAQPVGIHLTLTGRISKNRFQQWVENNWNEIEELMNEVELSGNWEPQIRELSRFQEIHKQRQKKTKYSKMAQEYSEREDLSTDDYDALIDEPRLMKDHSRFKSYIKKLKTSQKVT